MRNIKQTSIFAVLAAFALLCAGELFAQTNFVSYRTIAVQTGVPDFKPIQNRIPTQAYSASIPVPDSLGSVYMCYGLNRDNKFVLCQMNRKTNGMTDVAWIPLAESEGDTVHYVTDFTLQPGQTLRYPLEFVIIRSQHTLSYRWPLSKDTSIAGGVPTPASQAINVRKPLPSFFVKTLDDRFLSSSDLEGKIYVINWWATWCGACVLEIPGFNKLVDEFGSTVRFLAIARNTPEELKPFLAKRPFRFLQTLAGEETIGLFGGAFPRTIVLNAEGVVVFDETGGGTEKYLDIRKVLLSALQDKQ